MKNEALSKLENENLQKYLHYVGYKLYEHDYPLVQKIDLDKFPRDMFENIDRVDDITYNLFVPIYDKYGNLKKIRLIRDNEFNFVLIDKRKNTTYIDFSRNLTSEQAWNFIYFFPLKTKTKAGTYCPMNKEIAKLENMKIIKNSDTELSRLIDIYISNYDLLIEKIDEIMNIMDIDKRENESLKLFDSYSNNINEMLNKNEFFNVEHNYINSVININEAEELFNVLDDNSHIKIENILLLELENSSNSSEDMRYYLELYFKATGQIVQNKFSLSDMKNYINEVINKNEPTFYKNCVYEHIFLGFNIYKEKIYEDKTNKHRYKFKDNLQYFEYVSINEIPTINSRYERGKIEYLTKDEFNLLNRKKNLYNKNSSLKRAILVFFLLFFYSLLFIVQFSNHQN